MSLGMREEGGCPFVHFDEANLVESLSSEVTQKNEIINEIFRLKAANNPCGACNVYRAAYVKVLNLGVSLEGFNSPLTYYRSLKLSSNPSLDW